MGVVAAFLGCGQAVRRGAIGWVLTSCLLACAKPAQPVCPADTDATLSAELSALRGEIALLRGQQARTAALTAADTADKQAVTDKEAHATQRMLARSPEQQTRINMRRLRAAAADLRAELLAQWRDEVWAATMETRARARAPNMRPPGLMLDRIRCASTMCELSFSAASVSAAQLAAGEIESLLQQSGGFSCAFEYDLEVPEKSKVNIFVSRANHALRVPDVGPDDRFE